MAMLLACCCGPSPSNNYLEKQTPPVAQDVKWLQDINDASLWSANNAGDNECFARDREGTPNHPNTPVFQSHSAPSSPVKNVRGLPHASSTTDLTKGALTAMVNRPDSACSWEKDMYNSASANDAENNVNEEYVLEMGVDSLKNEENENVKVLP